MLEHFTQHMDAPNAVWSNNHLPYSAASTEPAQLLTCGEKCSQEKHHLSKNLHTKSASSFLYMTHICCLDEAFCAVDYARADSCISINMEQKVLVCTAYLIHYISDTKGTLKK